MRSISQKAGLGLALVSAMTLAGCAGSKSSNQAAVEYRGTGSGGAVTQPAPGAPATGPGGVIAYDGYEAIRASQGDTVASLADRVGLSASELGSYNGLSPTQQLRAGDELVLPPRPGGYGGTAVASASTATGAGATPGIVTTTPGPTFDTAAPASAGTAAAESAAPATSSGGWSPDLAAAAIDRAGTADAPLEPPPSAATPLPPEPERPADLPSPDLGQYQTPAPSADPSGTAAATTAATERAAVEAERAAEQELAAASPSARPAGLENLRLTKPVDGPVVVGYDTWGAGGTRNEGVDFAAPVGTPVVAAADGSVALVSPSLGGLGTIVVVRHPDELLTVYGRVEGVTVGKGTTVRRGQPIGTVAPSPDGGEPRMHFEVRRGAVSVDPMPFF
ncbi:peptidoglycan DD-metalloendopeptidase family protein [Limibaculum sp. M0105]|uniref:Peptidoglycan DD-metalloendopeptidase family protein n=1 Tax=Thermohalobaculum xanthum TaxID=2753746 RepID=A0A8J7S9N1_9RHOB|nr:M23 family metallopeptidase [Thermohalobaculum xanthum]MBK0397802.1 peptidoglycan DD-metalloendopeptidase family protein [Thermohalobaculum xanthum]